MIVYNSSIEIKTINNRNFYCDVTSQVKKTIEESNIENGICVVMSPHTTCSILFEEYSHDFKDSKEEFLQLDLDNVLNQVIPDHVSDKDYWFPGPEHIKFANSINKKYEKNKQKHKQFEKKHLLNADAHLKATLIGSSETFIIEKSTIQIGEFGYIYFIDWDRTRDRIRHCKIQILGM